jgi:hypothetical protein
MEDGGEKFLRNVGSLSNGLHILITQKTVLNSDELSGSIKCWEFCEQMSKYQELIKNLVSLRKLDKHLVNQAFN